MKIKLYRGEIAQIDIRDWPRVQHYRWYARKSGKNNNKKIYAFATINHKPVALHRFILGLKPGDGKIGDHINHKGLDNRQSNLRIVTPAENVRHRKIPAKHVYFSKKQKKWVARIQIGSFDSKLKAQKAYSRTHRLLFGG